MSDSSPPPLDPADIARLLRNGRYRYCDEYQLQEAVVVALQSGGYSPRREVLLGPKCRVDVLVGNVGIEIKTAGTVATVARQLQRYAQCDQISSLILVTSLMTHRALPKRIGGMELEVICPIRL